MALPIKENKLTYNNSTASTHDAIVINDSIKLLTLVVADNGSNLYASSGTIEFSPIDLGEFYFNIKKVEIQTSSLPSGTSYIVSTSTSTNMVEYSPYVATDPDLTINSPQGRYIKVKIELFGATGVLSFSRLDFLASDSDKLSVDSQIALDGNMYLKTDYANPMLVDTSVVGEKLFSFPLNKNTFKKIDKIEVI